MGAPDAADFTGTTEELQAMLAEAPEWRADATNTRLDESAHRLFVRAHTLSAPPVSWRVEGLIADAMLHVLAGKDKRGKTLLAEEIARAVLRGLPFVGEFPSRRGAVMAALLDDPLGLTLERLDKLAVRGPEDDCFIVNPADFGEPMAFLDALEAEALELRPALIIIDALYLFVPESRDAGNDAARMKPVMLRLDRLATRTGAAVLLIAHDNKSGQDVAGSYVVRATAKVIMRLTLPKGEAVEEDDGPTTDRRVLSVESKLVRSATHLLELRGVGDWAYLGDPTAARTDDLRAAVLSHLRSGGVGTAEEIAGSVKRRREAVDHALAALVASGDVTVEQVQRAARGRPATVYRTQGNSRPPAHPAIADADGNSRGKTVERRGDAGQTAFPSASSPPGGERGDGIAKAAGRERRLL